VCAARKLRGSQRVSKPAALDSGGATAAAVERLCQLLLQRAAQRLRNGFPARLPARAHTQRMHRVTAGCVARCVRDFNMC
jgi:hypothetical protein